MCHFVLAHTLAHPEMLAWRPQCRTVCSVLKLLLCSSYFQQLLQDRQVIISVSETEHGINPLGDRGECVRRCLIHFTAVT